MVRLASGVVFVLAALVTFGWLFLADQWSGKAQPPAEAHVRPSNFAADRTDLRFDAKRAMGYLEDICKIGPRISGTDGMKKQQEMLQKHFKSLGGQIEWQRFTAKQKSQPQPVDMANLIVSWFPEQRRRIILCSHYDTRPIADQEPDRRKWREPFLSANDGGSGVALLMEMAHFLKDLKPAVGVDLVFFDGEEYIFNNGRDGDLYFLGSEHFAQVYREKRSRPTYVAAVLLDMIGGKNVQFTVEQNSWFKAAALVQEIWQLAADKKCEAFKEELGPDVRDDHLALNQAGIPAVDIIDFNYPHWHRLSDLPENCSGDSLAQVARVLTFWLQQVK